MGCGASAAAVKPSASKTSGFKMIPDQYKSLEEVTQALRQAGLESSQLIVGVDFTGSNQVTGAKSFHGLCLHDTDHGINPYQKTLSIIAQVLADFDDDNLIPAYGFGDSRTSNKKVFSFRDHDKPCNGLDGVLEAYNAIVPCVDLGWPTSFAALIRKTIEVVRETGEYHILLIIADGQVNEVKETADAIVEASNYPISIVMVGVGDGPWEQMNEFDDELPQRRFDNFQFVELEAVFKKYSAKDREAAFAVNALMEVPEQYQEIKRLGLLDSDRVSNSRAYKKFCAPRQPVGPPQKTTVTAMTRQPQHFGA
jgi:hypothetical protein